MKRFLIILAILLCILLGGGIIWFNGMKDKTGPEITFPTEEITYEEGNKEVLLEGVTATDDVDGDVSDSVRVNGIFPNATGSKANVLYVAKDKNNNISKATREVIYSVGNVEETNATSDDTEEETTVTQAEQVSEPIITPEVSVALELSITPVAEAGAPQITLSDSEITISRGTSINRLIYVQDITDDQDDRNALYRGIQIAGEVDTTTPGEYELIYHVVDSDGNRSNEAKLTVIVR